jgi:type II secretory pathway pseudopilin PulG
MTIVEIAVVMGLMALLAVLMLPKLDSGTGLAIDQQATTTASGALDTVLTQVEGAGGPVALGPGTVSASVLAAANGDISFVDSGTASTSTAIASVGSAGTKVAVAVLGDPATNACWYTWRDLAATGSNPSEAFFVRSVGSGLPCDASTALALHRPTGDTGARWTKPQQVA